MSDFETVKNLEGMSTKLCLNLNHMGVMTFQDSYMDFEPSKLEILTGASIYATRALSETKSSLMKTLLSGNVQKSIRIPYSTLTGVSICKPSGAVFGKCLKVLYLPTAFSGGYGSYLELSKNGKDGKTELEEIMNFLDMKIKMNKSNVDSVVQDSSGVNGVSEFCPQCGTKFGEGNIFCPKCGNKR